MAAMNFSKGLFYWAPSLVCACFWCFALAVFTDLLAPFGITFFTAGLLVVIPALLMPFYRGLLCVFLSGCVVDASLPIPFELTHSLSFWAAERHVSLFGDIPADIPAFFGFVAGWMIFAYLVLRLLRSRISAVNPLQWMVSAEIVNAIIFVFWATAMGWTRFDEPAYWGGLLLNLFFSALVMFIFGWWFFDLQLAAYRLCGIDIIREREGEGE